MASLSETLKANVAKAKLKEELENQAASAKPLEDGMVLVRLTRGLLQADGRILNPGIHRLPAGSVPKSAKVLKD